MDFYLADSITVFFSVSIFAVIFLVFFRRGLRQRFFYLWTAGWALTLLHYLAQVAGSVSPVELLWPFFMDRLLLAISVVIFYYSARELFSLRTPRSALIVLGMVFLVLSYLQIYHPVEAPKTWSGPNVQATLQNVLVQVNSDKLSLLLGAVLFSTGVIFLRHRRKFRSIGITVLAGAFLFWGLGFLALPILLRWSYWMPLVAQLLNLPKPVVAAGMIIFLFEQEKIDAQKHRDEAVEQRDFIQNLMDSAHDAVYVTGRTGNLQWTNRRCEKLLRLNAATLQAKDHLDFVAPEERAMVERAAARVLEGTPQSLEVKVVVPQEERIRTWMLSMTPIRDVHNRITGILSLGRDVTEVKTMERQLQHAEKLMALGRLISSAAHELNNPLTTVMGFSELSLQDPQIDPKLHRRFERILQAATRSKHIVEDLQNFVRVPDHSVQPISINELAVQALTVMENDLKSNRIETHWQFCPESVKVNVDGERMRGVIESILRNAVEAISSIRPSGTIWISTKQDGGNAVLSIADDGPGIQDPARIFEPFYSTKAVGKSYGMTLSVSYSMVQHYGGRIEVDQRPRGGATFRIVLPAASADNVDATEWNHGAVSVT
jgi:PAS domain S-box-containing protein